MRKNERNLEKEQRKAACTDGNVFGGSAVCRESTYQKRGRELPFSPDRNFYYVTGIEREDCILFLAKTRTGVEETLYIPRDNGVMAKWVGANMTAEEATGGKRY